MTQQRHVERLVDQTGLASLATRDQLLVPLLIAGVRRLSIDWTVHFDRPPTLSFDSSYPGGAGPKVHVSVRWPSEGGRVRFDARKEGGATQRVFLEQEDVAGYRVSSNGGHGTPLLASPARRAFLARSARTVTREPTATPVEPAATVAMAATSSPRWSATMPPPARVRSR